MEDSRPSIDQTAERGRLRWRCRRGMRELDGLLAGFLDREFDRLSVRERAAFATILELPDPEILGLLLGRTHAEDPCVADVIAALRRAPRALP